VPREGYPEQVGEPSIVEVRVPRGDPEHRRQDLLAHLDRTTMRMKLAPRAAVPQAPVVRRRELPQPR
jgi:hypothetical protein